MSTNYQPPPSAPPQGPPPGPPPAGVGGHGAFSEEDIQQIMAQTGMSYQEVCAAIDQTGATSAEQLLQELGTAGAPTAPSETVAPGVVQGQPPQGPGAPPAMAGAPASAAAAPGGIDPEVAQAVHDKMSPAARYQRSRK